MADTRAKPSRCPSFGGYARTDDLRLGQWVYTTTRHGCGWVIVGGPARTRCALLAELEKLIDDDYARVLGLWAAGKDDISIRIIRIDNTQSGWHYHDE